MAYLAKSIKLCYTYDVLNRVTKRTKKNLSDDTVISEETFTYDAAGNVTSANGETAQYSLNNRIMVFNGSSVGCDADGNLNSIMFDGGRMNLSYDSKNRLTSAGGHTYTYDAEDVRIRNLCGDVDTTYAYDTNGNLSRLLMKTTNGVTTKYVYGIGLIGEQTGNSFKCYHFDSRGSTVAITGGTGIVMDTFEYDTYGKLTSHTGNNEVIFGYNGRDGVVTDANGLLYMRARYYSPEMRRFVNADVLAGEISDAITLNRYAHANGNPVSFVDPFGLKAMEKKEQSLLDKVKYLGTSLQEGIVTASSTIAGIGVQLSALHRYGVKKISTETKPKRVPKGSFIYKQQKKVTYWDDILGESSALATSTKIVGNALEIGGYVVDGAMILVDTGIGIKENLEAGTDVQKIVTDAIVDVRVGIGLVAASTAVGMAVGSLIPVPGLGTFVGGLAGTIVGAGLEKLMEYDVWKDKSILDLLKDTEDAIADAVVNVGKKIGDTAKKGWNTISDAFSKIFK